MNQKIQEKIDLHVSLKFMSLFSKYGVVGMWSFILDILRSVKKKNDVKLNSANKQNKSLSPIF